MAVLYANNATTTLSASITSTATSFSVATGKGALFPVVAGSDYFYATLSNTAGAIEIVKVTLRSGDNFIVTRGQDGTTGVAWAAGDKVDLRITKALLDDFKTDTKGSLSLSNVTTALGFTPYNATNPSGYTSNTGTVTSVGGTGSVAGLTLSGSVSTSGNLTLSGTLSTSVDNITDEYRLFNNMGDNHGTRTTFDASAPSYNFGWRYVQGNGNSPGVNSAAQYYSLYVGLGNDYAATGAGSYGMMLAVPRNVTTPYLAIRYNENNAFGAWQKISAGYADSAGSVAWTNVTSRPTAVSSFTNDSGYITGITSGMVTTALGYTPYNSTNPNGYITSSASISGYSYGVSVLDTDRSIANRLPTSTGQSVRFDFAYASGVGTGGNYAGVMTFSPWTGTTGSTGDASYQLVFGSTATNGSGTPRLRIRNGIDSTWNTWYDLFTGANFATDNGWTPTVSGGVTRVSQSMWAKTGGNASTWDGQLYSAEAYPTHVFCQASFGTTSGPTMFGLNTLDGTTDTNASYTVIDYAWYGNSTAGLEIYESGTSIGSYGSYTSSTVCTITYDGSNIRYYKDGVIQRTVARATGNGLYFDSSFYSNNYGSQLFNVQFGRLPMHVIRQDNIGSFAPTLTGGGASGSWGISITGSAASITGTYGGSLTSSQVTTALGFTPYNSTNPSGYITSSGSITGSAGSVTGLTLTSSANGINPDSVTQNQIGYANALSILGQTDGALYSSAYSSSWIHEIYGDFRTGQIAIRGKNNGTWQSWRTVLDSSNYNSYSPTLTGGSASGTWGINITGNSATTSQTNFSSLTVSSNTVLTTANIGSYAAVNVADGCMQTNNQTIANNYTLGATTNAVSAGPITVNTGVTVTISTGATWVVV